MSEKDFEKSIKIFLNPTNNIFKIQSDFMIEKTEIYSIQGEKILETFESEINLSYFSEGIYFLKIKTEKGVFMKKVLKI